MTHYLLIAAIIAFFILSRGRENYKAIKLASKAVKLAVKNKAPQVQKMEQIQNTLRHLRRVSPPGQHRVHVFTGRQKRAVRVTYYVPDRQLRYRYQVPTRKGMQPDSARVANTLKQNLADLQDLEIIHHPDPVTYPIKL